MSETKTEAPPDTKQASVEYDITLKFTLYGEPNRRPADLMDVLKATLSMVSPRQKHVREALSAAGITSMSATPGYTITAYDEMNPRRRRKGRKATGSQS